MPIETLIDEPAPPSAAESLPAAPPEPPGILASTAISTRTSTAIGQLAFETLPTLVERVMQDRDNSFDAYKFNTPEFFDQHPYMVKPFRNGTVDDIPNEATFWSFVDRRREDHDLRERLGSASLPAQFIGGAIPAIAELALGGELLGAAKGGRILAEAAGWAREGGLLARAIKSVAAGAATNVAYDQVQRALNQNRDVDEEHQLAWSAGMGAAFGAVFPFLGAAKNRVLADAGEVVSVARLRRMQREVGETLASKPVTDILEVAKQEREALRDAINETPARSDRNFGEGIRAQGPDTISPADADFMLRLAQDTAGKDASRPFTILDDGTPETAKLIEEARAKGFEIHEHPLQSLYDLQKTIDGLKPVELGVIGRTAVKVLGAVSPEGKLIQSPSILARKATRLFFDVGLPTREQAAVPVTTDVAIPAESLRMQYQGWHDVAAASIDQAMRDGIKAGEGGRKGFTYTASDGTVSRIRTPWLDRDKFYEAVTDHMRQLAEAKRAGEGATPPEAPAPVKKAAAAVVEYTARIADDLKEAGLIRDNAELDPLHILRRYNRDAIEANTADFKARLIEQQRLNSVRDFKTGKPVAPQDQVVDPGVVEYSRVGRAGDKGLTMGERESIKALATEAEKPGAKPDYEKVTLDTIKSALGDDVLARYIEERELWFERRADTTVKTLLDPPNSHGVDRALSVPKALGERLIDMDETRFKPYLDQNIGDLIATYNHQVGGRLAARLAIKLDEASWADAVKKATGKDLAAEGYDPQLVIDAIKGDFQKWIDATAGDKVQETFQASKQRTVDLLEKKLAQLEGRPVFPNNPSASVGWGGALMRFTGKQLLRLPFMAMMGKSAIANATDAAALSYYTRMTPQHLGTVAEALNFFREVPNRRNLEGLYVATSDLARTIHEIEIGDAPGDMVRQPFGPGRLGRGLTIADTAIGAAQKGFTKLTGIHRVNTNLKRAAATLVQQDLFQVAKQLAKAKELVDAGMPEAAAIAQVGLEPWKAQSLSRMGMNGARAQRLLKILDEHAADAEGNKLGAAWRDHDGWISPEMREWYGNDKDLYRVINHAVNTEVLNLIVEPKLLSRPVIASTWTGRAFNMFQNFTFAWGNQLAPLAAQRPAYQTLRYLGLSVGMSALADALYAKLSGKRDFQTTADLWRDKPYHMIYAAVNRSPLLGWLQRPIGALESLGVGPAQAAGIELTSQYGRRDANIGDVGLGPVYSWAQNLFQGTTQSLRDPGYWDRRGNRQLWNALPYHNLWQMETLNRTAEDMGYDTPLGPAPRPQLIP